MANAQQGVNQVNVVINYQENEKFNRCRMVTVVKLKLGALCVAEAKLGGRYSQQQAWQEFCRNPNRFAKREGYHAAQRLQLVP